MAWVGRGQPIIFCPRSSEHCDEHERNLTERLEKGWPGVDPGFPRASPKGGGGGLTYYLPKRGCTSKTLQYYVDWWI